MKLRMKLLLAALVACLAMNQAAHAGVYGDDLAKCLVRSTTSDQKSTLVQWVFAVTTLHPLVKPLSAVTDEQRTKLDKQVAAMFQTLLTDSCKQESLDAVKYEGTAAFQASFAVLGQVAMRELFTDPTVQKGIGEFTQYLDKSKFDELMKASGSAPQPAPPASTRPQN